MASAFGVGLYIWRIEPHWVQVARRALPITGLPAVLQGCTLVQLSDIHVGAQVSDDYVNDAFELVRSLAPDIVVCTGDFTSYHADICDHAAQVYQNVPQGRLATVDILGNHDYGPSWSHPEFAGRLAKVLADQGMNILRNQVVDVGGLQIAGMDDLWAGRFDPARTLASLDRQRPALVLSHNPDTVDVPGWAGYQGWILSGHTHGGQCKPPFLPPPLLPVKNRRYTSGEFDLRDGRRLYINSGLGHLLRVRFNVRPEVTVFQLVQA
jgi:hypothetical protein